MLGSQLVVVSLRMAPGARAPPLSPAETGSATRLPTSQYKDDGDNNR